MPQASAPTACLIVEPLPVVAHDLATTLREALHCEALVAGDEAQASGLLSDMTPGTALRLAVIRMKPDVFAQSALRPMIEAHDAAIVLMGGNAIAHAGETWPWALLEWPFGTGQLMAVLGALGLQPTLPADMPGQIDPA